MSKEELTLRLLSSRSAVDSKKIKRRRVDAVEERQVAMAQAEIAAKGNRLCIIEGAGMSITEVVALGRTLVEQRRCVLLIIDHLHNLSGDRGKRDHESLRAEMIEITRLLKNMARELNVPVMALSQLSREVDKRQGHKPITADLRESGSIEQDADEVLLLHRPEKFQIGEKPGEAELHVSKNRNGPEGTVRLEFKKELTKFVNYQQSTPSFAAKSYIDD